MGVRYLTDEERKVLRVYGCDHMLCNRDGALLDPELEKPEFIHRDGIGIFVIDVDQKVWITFDHKYGEIHHSSLLAGGPVIAAGEVVISRGQLQSISNASGHYKPPPQSIDVALRVLSELGVDVSRVKRFEIRVKP